MKMASFCFNLGKNEVGGAQVPAVAFYEWCHKLGYSCDLVTHGVKEVSEDLPRRVKIISDESELNEYDAVFFSTPGALDGRDFNWWKVTTKTAVMAHAEFDRDLYRDFYTIMRNATVPVVIGENFYDFDNQKVWYPCCLPEYLIDFHEDFSSAAEKGVYYAARLSRWKNADVLCYMSKFKDFQKQGMPVIYGRANDKTFMQEILEIDPIVCFNYGVFNTYKVYEMIGRNRQYAFYWDVSGNKNYEFKLRRFNLAAVEAMKAGCIPIVKRGQEDPRTSDFVVYVEDILENPNHLNEIDVEERRSKMLTTLAENEAYNYFSVRDQVRSIIEALENK